MSVIAVAAELVRRAAADENYAIDLDNAIYSDESVRRAMLFDPIEPAELTLLQPSQWLWFSRWRQDLGGTLDLTVLNWLSAGLPQASRSTRYRVRGLAMRDQIAGEIADDVRSPRGALDSPVLTWVVTHASSYPDQLEVARDSLQYATPVSWLALRVLTEPIRPGADAVRSYLRTFAEARGVEDDVVRAWYFRRFDDT